VKIVLNEEQIFAGRPIAAKCETWGSSPAARIVWRLGEHVIGDPNVSTTQRSNSTVSKLALVLSKDDDGKELVCRAENPRFPGGVLEEIKMLRISCEFSTLQCPLSNLVSQCNIKNINVSKDIF